MNGLHATVSSDDLVAIADRYGFDVSDGEAEGLAEAVTNRLDDALDQLYRVPVERTATDHGRKWHESTDPYNALTVRCDVSAESDRSEDGTLRGFSVGVKDNIAVRDVPMQCGSGAMRGFVPTTDATVVRRLLDAGATVGAKTNLDEFAGGGRGRSFTGLIHNPRDPDRSAGGSSGGSAAAVAAGLVDVALGTDTGGSVRKPAAFCGLVGVKPTYGLVPLTGVVENTYTLDHVGTITTTVVDAARVLATIAGRDPRDTASMAAAGRDAYRSGGYLDGVRPPPSPEELRIAVGERGLSDDIDDPVARRHHEAIDRLVDAGIDLRLVELPDLDVTKQVKNVISYVELAAFWRDAGMPIRRGSLGPSFDRVGFSARARSATAELNQFYRSRLLAGAVLMETYGGRHYARALAVRDALREELTSTLADVDALVTPTVPYLAPELDRARADDFDYDGLERAFGYGRYTKLANVTGVPAVTVPNETSAGPAVGLQLLGTSFDEARLFGVAERVSRLLR